jgi:hypothetical protein
LEKENQENKVNLEQLKNKLFEIENGQDKEGYLFKMNKSLKLENNSLKDALEAKISLTRIL